MHVGASNSTELDLADGSGATTGSSAFRSEQWSVVSRLGSPSVLAKVDLSAQGVCANPDALAVFDKR